MKKKILIMIAVIVAIVLGAIIGLTVYNNTDAVKLKKQLDFGHKYLADLDYEQAIAAFENALQIDGSNTDAFNGLADAYYAMEDYDNYEKTLQRGIDATGSDELKKRLDDYYNYVVQGYIDVAQACIDQEDYEAALEIIQAGIEDRGDQRLIDMKEKTEEAKAEAERKAEEAKMVMSADEFDKYVEEAASHIPTWGPFYYHFNQFTDAQRVESMADYLESMEIMIPLSQYNSNTYVKAAEIYEYIGEMEKCLETRRIGYEKTGALELTPDGYTDADGYVFNQFGQLIERPNGSKYEYNGNKLVVETGSDGYQDTFTYDEDGRYKMHMTNKPNVLPEIEFTYNGNEICEDPIPRDPFNTTAVNIFDDNGNYVTMKERSNGFGPLFDMMQRGLF